jgi:outer membrane protein TolC
MRDVVLEIKQSLRNLHTSYELVSATRNTRLALTENLRTLLIEEERRSSLTPEFLRLKLDSQQRLAQAQLAEIEAIANTKRAWAAYRRAIGTGAPVAKRK